MILGGGAGQKQEKKTQRLLAQEKSSTASCRGKKTQHEFSARGPQIINGPPLISFLHFLDALDKVSC